MKVEIATTITPSLIEAMEKLVPQLSRSNPPPTEAQLEQIVASPSTDLFLALTDAGEVVGMATLVTFRIPTSLRARIEDVVVDESARRGGVASALTDAMLARARELGCSTVDLTSRPSRQAANQLYQRLGFVLRESNTYRYDLPRSGSRR